MIKCDNSINEGLTAEDEELSDEEDSEEVSGDEDDKIMSKL
jgi:hypothetical protein